MVVSRVWRFVWGVIVFLGIFDSECGFGGWKCEFCFGVCDGEFGFGGWKCEFGG